MKKGRLVAYIMFVLLVAGMCVGLEMIPHHYTIEIVRDFPDGQYSDSQAEFLFFDGENWNATEDTAWIKPHSGILRIRISEQIMDSLVWRLDPINEPCDVIIRDIKLKDNGITVKNLAKNEILEGIKYAANISDYENVGNGIIIHVENNDPWLEFTEEFVAECKETLLNNRIGNLLFVFLPVALVGFGFAFPQLIQGTNQKFQLLFQNKKLGKFYFFFFVTGMIMLAILLYRDYLFGNMLYVFKDVGGDSYTQTYPYYMYRMKYYAAHGEFPRWSFSSGLGNAVGFNIWDGVAALFGIDAAPVSLVIVQVFKVVLSGIFFFGFLRTMGLTNLSSALFSYCFAYCGHMTVRAAWTSYPGEVLTLAILLWAFEQWFCRKRWFFLPPAVFWLFYTNSTYFSILHVGILCGYAIYRYQTADKRLYSWKQSIVILAGTLFIGIGIAGASPIRNLLNMADNPRISGSSGMIQDTIQNGIKWGTDVETLAVTVVRSLAPNALDIDIAEYQGVSNYLTDPVFYCGIFCLLIISQLFHGQKKKIVIWHGIVLAVAALYVICPVFRNLLSGFTGDYQYRMNSFWITVVLVVLASQAFDRIYRNQASFSARLFYGGVFLWTVLGATELYVYQSRVDNIHLNIAISFLFLYACVMLLWHTQKLLAGIVLLTVTVVELYVLSYDGISDRNVLLKTEIENHLGYYDYTSECMQYLHEADNDPMYRVAKDFYSVYLCDSLIQDYNGLTSYQGGTSHSSYLLAFVDLVNGATANMGIDKASSIASSNFILGFRDSGEIMTILSTKYLLSKQDQVSNFGYRQIANIGDVNIFKNEFYIPFGYLYDSYLSFDQYQALEETEKRKIFMKTCILPKGMAPPGMKTVSEAERVLTDDEKLGKRTLIEKKSMVFNERIDFEPDTEKGRTMLLDFDICAEKDVTGIICYADEGNDPNGYMNIPIAIKAGEHHYLFELSYAGIDGVRLVTDRDISGENIHINNFRISTVDSEEYYASYKKDAQNLGEHILKIESFQDDKIIGSIQAEVDSILYFSIPYDVNWKAYVDGQETEWINVNVGFSGVKLGAGEHQIELRYTRGDFAVSFRRYVFVAIYIVAVVIAAVFHRRKNEVLKVFGMEDV